ncbi:hypothetical protein BKA67DRAFT_696814 [Truncatella angustata]|uniref:Uncharacterized protein n=1 Tax=Truncatella angustata TaxID=152316 RepID=A0A9P8RJ69_9PEZI|nr:uncharacterized protein BKA67DRAFT_696814 [Truncatella angustata]KAH6645091.1 hypothetical protein BKA67DRAFT_696814 [Truncatella angustata]
MKSSRQQDRTGDPRSAATKVSQVDAILISSDKGSDYGDSDNSQADAMFPRVEKLPLSPERDRVEDNNMINSDKSPKDIDAGDDRDTVIDPAESDPAEEALDDIASTGRATYYETAKESSIGVDFQSPRNSRGFSTPSSPRLKDDPSRLNTPNCDLATEDDSGRKE